MINVNQFNVGGLLSYHLDVSKNRGTPKASIFIGFSIIFTIHFGGFPPIFGLTPICFVKGILVFKICQLGSSTKLANQLVKLTDDLTSPTDESEGAEGR